MSLVNEMLQDLQNRDAGDVKPLAGLRVVKNDSDSGASEKPPVVRGRIYMIAALAVVTAGVIVWHSTKSVVIPDAALPVIAFNPNVGVSINDVAQAGPGQAEEIFKSQILQLRPTMHLAVPPEGRPVKAESVVVKRRDEARQAKNRAPVVVVAKDPSANSDKGAVDPVEAIDNIKISIAADERLRRDGIAAKRNNKLQLAEQYFREWLSLDRQNAEAHQLLYETLLAQARPAAARSALLAALDAVEVKASFAQTLALDLLGSDRVSQAVLILQKHRPVATQNSDYDAMLAAALQRAGDHASAEKVYLGLVKRQPQNGAWWVGLAISQEANGRLLDARNSFATATLAVSLDDTLATYAFERLATLEAGS